MGQHNKLTVLKSVYFFAGIILIIGLGVSFPAIKKDVAKVKESTLTPDEYWSKAVEMVEKEDLIQAIEYFQQYKSLGGANSEVYLKLSELYVKTGQLQLALESAKKYTELESAFAGAYYQLGVVHHVMGEVENAKLDYQKAVDLNPNYTDAYFNLAFLFESEGQFLKAIELYKKVVGLDATNVKAFYNMGNSYANLGKDDNAIEAYKAVIDIDKDHMDAYVNLSIILARNGLFGESIVYLDEARLLGYEAPEEFLKQLSIYREDKAMLRSQKGGV